MVTVNHITLMFQIWNDEFLVWDPEEFDGITEISLSSDAIWVPDVIISELYVHDRCISPGHITSSFCFLEMNFVKLYSHCIICLPLSPASMLANPQSSHMFMSTAQEQ